MKRLLLVLLPLLLAFRAFSANPPYTAFLGTNGILVISNSPNGKILIDGSHITNGASPVFVTTNLFVVNNTYTSNLFTTNIFVNQTLVTSNVFTTNLTVQTITVFQTLFAISNIFVSNIYVTNIVVNNINVNSNLFVTNAFFSGITTNSGTIANRILTLPTTAGLGWFDGTNQWYSTNLTTDITVLLTNLMEGADYYLQVSNPASFTVTFTSIGNDSWLQHDYTPGSATTNGTTLFHFQRWGAKTNAFELGRELTLTNDDGSITFVTNRDTLVIRAVSGAIFSDLVWTNNLGTLYPVAYPTNIILNPTNRGSVGLEQYRTNFLFQVAPRRTGGTNVLFAVFNGGASAFVVGDQGIMIGSTNYITVPQEAIDISYDVAFGVDNPDKAITMTSINSVVGYSGTSEFQVNTNYGKMDLTANKEGNGFVTYVEQAGGDAKFINFDATLLIQDPAGTFITPYQIDPDFSLSPTGYLFGSTMRITNIDTLMSLQNSNTPVFEVNGIGDLKLLKRVAYSWPSAQGASQTVLTNDGSGNLGWGAVSATGGGLSGTTNVLNLSVQAAKLPATNYPAIDAGWQAWETVYAETNAEGARIATSAIWQFVVPPDYATNTLKLLINYSLSSTNGPNTSNVVFGVSILQVRSGTTNNVHTNLFGSIVRGSNDWIAKYDGTNIVTNLVIDLGVNSLLMPRDVGVLKLERLPTEDTYGGAVAVHGLQLEYTRP